MKRESYQTEMFNWCEALKDQIQKRGQLDQFEDQIDKMIEALEDDQTTEEDWYKQATAFIGILQNQMIQVKDALMSL